MARRSLAAVGLLPWAAAIGSACTTDFGDLFLGAGGGAAASATTTSSATGGAAVCGDAKLSAGEQCEDGASAAGDGCAANCHFEGGAYDTCPTGVVLRLASKIQIADSTQNHASGVGMNCGQGVAATVVYQIVPKTSGDVTVSADLGAGSGYVEVRSSCSTSGDSFACKSAQPTFTFTHGVNAGEPFYVVLRGKNGSKIDFKLTLAY